MTNKVYNIFEYLINYCEDTSPSSNDQDIIDRWHYVLNKGIALTAVTYNLCCEDCSSSTSGVTSLSSCDKFNSLVEAMGLTQNCEITGYTCCISVYGGSLKVNSVYQTLRLTGVPPPCTLSINNCIYLDFNTIFNRMISEFGYNSTKIIKDNGAAMFGNTSIKAILDYLDTKSENFRELFLIELLQEGVVYDCRGLGIIASVETYLKYAEAVGLTNPGSPVTP